jgi:acetyl esterase/lipase
MFTTVLLAVTLSAAPAVKVERDVVYTTAGGAKLKLDIAYPDTPGPHPAAVGFHGGAWKYGSKAEISKPNAAIFDFGGTGTTSLLEFIAKQGYVCVSVQYRLAPEHKWPAQIEDGKTAVRWLRKNATKYNIDKDHIAAFGFSAGGHIAACLGTIGKDAGFEGTDYADESSKVQCVVDYFGPADLTLYAETPGIEKAYMKPLLGTLFSEKPEVFKKASPVNHVTKESSPFLIFHGTLDVVVPMVHSDRLQAKLKDAGVECTLVPVKGKGHGWEGETATTTRTQAIEFLDKHLKAKK